MSARGWRVALLAVVLGVAPSPLAAQARAAVREPGPGRAGALLTGILSGQYQLIPPGDSSRYRLARGERRDTTVVVLGRDVTVAAEVNGDVVAVGGDIFLHPGANVRGRLIAFGGGVYDSQLGYVSGERLAFRDLTFDGTLADGVYLLDYRSLVIRHAGGFSWLAGARIPTYDRVNGLSLPYAYGLALADGRLEVEPRLTWRTHLGKVDPRLDATFHVNQRTRLEGRAERGTFTNDGWIFGDVTNSLFTLAVGLDMRNYFRADRAYGGIAFVDDRRRSRTEPRFGVQIERGWSAGQDSSVVDRSAPWSLFRRKSPTGMFRPNPAVDEGDLYSAIAALDAEFEIRRSTTKSRLVVEGMTSPARRNAVFQVELDASHRHPGIRPTHEFRFDLHGVASLGEDVSRRRYRALGGPGTLPFLDPLEQAGDQLLFLDWRYTVPIERMNLPFAGSPLVTARYVAGAAGVGALPRLEHNAGIRIGISLLRADVMTDLRRGGIRTTLGVSVGR
jgi:hypothetical protein